MSKAKTKNKSSLTPKEIVKELSRYIIGQENAKKSVALALRSRWRRKNVLPETLRDEIVPKNILMIGPTGVGKTEIARRLAKLANAPFIKIEATKFTELGYVGRDVDSIIRDLLDISIQSVRMKKHEEVKSVAKIHAENRLLDALVGNSASEETREKFREKLYKGELDDKEVSLEVIDNNPSGFGGGFEIPGLPGAAMGMINVGDLLGKALGAEKRKVKKMKISESYDVLMSEESDKLIEDDKIIKESIYAVEQEGIVFLDEIDKIAARLDAKNGQVSREGVQRDLLPIIEGTVVTTKYGPVKTDHILFIASGAFHLSKPSDLLPELQGRLPIRVELNALTEEDMVKILKEPESSLLKQYTALLLTEGVTLKFSDDAIMQIAKIAAEINREVENIGARRLHTIMEKLLEDVSFEATDLKIKLVNINAEYVKDKLDNLSKQTDLSKFIL